MIRFLWLFALGVCFAFALPVQPAAAQSIGCRLAGGMPNSLPPLPFTEERRVQIGEFMLVLRVCAPHAESLTAVDALNQVAQALPVLATHTDLPLRGSLERTIIIRDSAVMFARNVDGFITIDDFEISLHRLSRPSTIIHEAAHYWATVENFGDDWMVEGYAEYLTSLAAADLGVPYEPFEVISACEQFPLLYWNRENQSTVSCAYSVGPQIFHELEARVGAATLQRELMRLSARYGGVTSRDLLIALERASNADIVAVMRGRVFGPEDDVWLSQRQDVRRRILDVQPEVERLGIRVTDLRSAIDQYAFDEVTGVLTPLTPLVQAATLVDQQCQTYGLTCARPWASAHLAQHDWPALTVHLQALTGLLAFYGEQHQSAIALNLELPQPLRERVASFDPQAESGLHEVTITLSAIATVERACAERALACRPTWETAWAASDYAGVQLSVNETLTLFNRAAVTETRCTELYAACVASWQPAFATDGAAGAHQALDELEALFGRAAALERQCADLAPECERHWRSAFTQGTLADAQQAVHGLEALFAETAALELQCGDLGETCRRIWRTAVRDEGVSAAADQVAQLDAFLQHAAVVEQECVAMDWPCNTGWRAAFLTQGGDAAEQLLNEQRAALVSFGDLQSQFGATQLARILQVLLGQDQVSEKVLRQAREAFNAGDIAAARHMLTTASAQQQRDGSTLVWSITLIAVTLITILSISVLWLRRRQHARPPLTQRSQPADADVLANLLSTPPDQGR